MLTMTDEEFIKSLEEEFPGEDWDNAPDLNTYADVYNIRGQEWVISYDVFIKEENKFVCRTDSSSEEGAIAYLQQQVDLGVRPGLENKELCAKVTISAEPRKMHFEIDEEYQTIEEAQRILEEWKLKSHVIAESLNIVKLKPGKEVYKSLCKSHRDKILQKRKDLF